jgi:hypothetical protein
MIMNNQLQPMNNQTELDNLADAVQDDVGFQKMLKFKKGEYFCDNQEVQLGTQMIAHCIGYTQVWIKFVNNEFIERKIYRRAKGERPVERESLGDLNESQWNIGLNGQPADPWVLQSLLPMENPETEDVCVFVSASAGGRRAIAELVDRYVTRMRRHAASGQPMIRLHKIMMPTKKFGNVPRPLFDVVGWTEQDVRPSIRDVQVPETLGNADMDDEIPF